MTPKQSDTASGGVAVAVVTNNKDPDKLCRVKVRYPWHDQAAKSYWARLAMPMAGNDRGLVLIPEVGDEVLVAFERGDLRFPYVLGALWNGNAKPPVANSNGKNDHRILKSRKGHKLVFDDGPRGAVEVVHVDGRRVVLDDDGIRIEDAAGNQVRIESASGMISIQANGALTIKAATISIEAVGTMDLKAGGTLTVRGSVVNIN
jgi:uncharacterized protein involved in type VI secretion and phage assembly